MDLKKIREEIDSVDTTITKAFEERMLIVDKVAKYKIENNMEVLDSSREKLVIEKATEKVETPYAKPYVAQLYNTIMGISRNRQKQLILKSQHNKEFVQQSKLKSNSKVGYLGILGSFSYQAYSEYFNDATPVSCNSFSCIFDKLTSGEIDCAILPVENTTTGEVNQAIDLLTTNDIWIYDEYVIKVEHHLLGVGGAKKQDIRTVYSHPQPVQQCDEYLIKNNISPQLAQSTAHGCKKVKDLNDTSCGAIASKFCAKIYGLNILDENIHTHSFNYTRFIVILKDKIQKPTANKISIIATIGHKPGALAKLIEMFAKQNINLQKLISRPIPNNPWQYNFHLDFDGNFNDNNVQEALSLAQDICENIKILGCYPSHKN